jgi:WD40 repeat protein/tRNA A-37 threonylcarbamoyl transferase component Bud32
VTSPAEPTPALKSLDAVIASYVQVIESGLVPNRQELLEQYPGLAKELRAFFADFDRMDRVASPLRLGDGTDLTNPVDGSSAAALPLVRYFGDYELLEEIARGGMGVVYKARQISLNRIVALKMILAGALASSREVQRFRAEAEAAANLDHPHIVPIFEIGEHNGHQYYSMKFVEGDSLSRHPRGNTGSEVQGVIDVARAVHHAHQHAVLHRDLKPSNVLVDSQATWFVTDFGLAKRLVDTGASLTESGQMLGTPRYMAPEQAAGRKDLTVAADVYSLGVILFERLTGQTPFTGDNVLTLLRRVRENEPPRPSSIRPGLDRDLETIVLKCLDKEPRRRYPSALALADDLDCWKTGKPITARPVGAATRAWKWAMRNKAVAVLSASVAALLVGAVVVSTLAAFRLAAAARTQTALARSAQGLYLAAQSELVRPADPGLAIVLALEAADRHPGPTANDAVIAALEANHELHTLAGHEGNVGYVAVAPDGRMALTTDDVSRDERLAPAVRVWNIETGAVVATLKHDGTVGVARFLPDGQRLVTYSSSILRNPWGDGAVAVKNDGMAWDLKTSVWDYRTGRRLAESVESVTGEMTWRINPARSMDVSPEGKRAVVTSGLNPGHPPRLIDLESGTVHAELSGHDGPVVAVAFSPAGLRVATASTDQTARIWDAESGKELRRLEAHKCLVAYVAFSPDGRRLVTLGDQHFPGGIPGAAHPARPEAVCGRIWDVESGKETAALRWPNIKHQLGPGIFHDTEQFGTNSLACFSADSAAIYTVPNWIGSAGSENRHPAQWDAATAKLLLTLERPDRGSADATRIALSADGRKIAIGDDHGLISLFDAHGELLRTLSGHTRAVSALVFTPDARRLISAGSFDRTARVWDTAIGDETEFARRTWPDVQRMTFSPDGRTVLVEVSAQIAADQGSAEKRQQSIQFRDTSTGAIRASITPFNLSPQAPQFSRDGRVVLVSQAFEAVLFEVATGRQIATFGPKNTKNGGLGRALSPDGQTVAFADGDLYLYDVPSGRELERIAGTFSGPAHHPFQEVQFSPDGTMVLTFGQSETARLWGARDGRPVAEFRHDASEFARKPRIDGGGFSPDGRLLATFAGFDSIWIWDTTTKKHTLELRTPGTIESVVFSPDGGRILSADRKGCARIWDAKTGAKLGLIQEDDELPILSLFSPDGEYVLTFSRLPNTPARLWDGYSGRPICTLIRRSDAVGSGGFSPEGQLVALSLGGVPRSTRVWPVDFLLAARARRPRDLSGAERLRFELPAD